MDIIEVSRCFPFISTIIPPTWPYRDPLPNSNVGGYIYSVNIITCHLYYHMNKTYCLKLLIEHVPNHWWV